MTAHTILPSYAFRSIVAITSVLALAALSGCDGDGTGEPDKPLPAASPILFVTQTPFHSTFDMITATFGNHNSSERFAPRGGDLMIVYPSGKLRNLTEEAGFGLERGEEIAVREPNVHWDGKRAVFSMVVGGTTENDFEPVYWQIYEVTGLGEGEAVQIERLPNQPATFNNLSPAYGTDGRIVFTSDRPRSGDMRHYPQLDEYESVATNTGVWSFDPKAEGGDLRLLSHAPSGAFSPKVALDGRVLFIRWDHLQRDQQADTPGLAKTYGAFDYASEDSDEKAGSLEEIFPEERADEMVKPGNHRHQFNHFLPWQINQDGTDEETLNHVGRHELVGYIESSRDGLPYHSGPASHPPITNFFHIVENPSKPGEIYGVNAPEFGTHTSGAIVKLEGHLDVNADDMAPVPITDPVGYAAPYPDSEVPAGHDGRYRNPLPLSDGSLLAVVSVDPHIESGEGEGPFGNATYRFRIRHMVEKAGTPYMTYGAPITEGITDKVSYFSNQLYKDVSYEGEMWEMDPVEVAARPVPLVPRTFVVPEIERGVIDATMGDKGFEQLRSYLKDKGLALVISRNVTRRADDQQPFNLAVPGGASTMEQGGSPDEISYIQFFQADQVRSYTEHREGRRPVPREMHSAPDSGTGPEGSYPLGKDGSFAALVPARRAVTWQLTGPDGAPVVRERYWVTFQPGEIRVCPNCHGINKKDIVLGEGPPQNAPEALAPLLQNLFE